MLGFVERGKIKALSRTLITLYVLLNALHVCNSRTVFNELIPEDPFCEQTGNHGCLCDRNLDCNKTKFLECVDGKCTCELSLHRTFDKNLGKCVSLVGSQCGAGWAPECVRNSECEGGRCTCREGYGITLQKNCSANFGEECGPFQCNSDRGLACKEGTCQCLDSSYVYSVIHVTCIDPEQVVQQFFQILAQRFIRGIVNFKIRTAMRTVTLPFRLAARLALGPFG